VRLAAGLAGNNSPKGVLFQFVSKAGGQVGAVVRLHAIIVQGQLVFLLVLPTPTQMSPGGELAHV
jgi:hypothetical protein